MAKINILYITHSPFMGGAELSLISHLKEIDKSRFNIYCVGSSLLAPFVENIEGVTFIKMQFFLLYQFHPRVLINYFRMVSKLVKIIKDKKIDIIHTNSVKSHYIGTMAAAVTGKKLIWWIRDTTFNTFLYHIFHFTAEKIISVSQFIKNFYIAEEKNIVIYNGSNVYKISVSQRQLTSLKKQLKLKGKFVIGAVERLVRWKGVQNLIKAFNPVAKKYPQAILLILGSGKNQAEDIEDQLKLMVKQLNLEASVKFLGWRADVPKIMRLFDVLVHPSMEPEPFGLVVLEAMMSKVLVASSNLGGPAEIIEQGKTGLLFDGSNIEQLTNILEKILTNKIDQERMVKTAFKYAVNNLSQQKETEKIERIYYQILSP